MATLGERLREMRLQAGLTQQQLAGREMTRAFICMVEKGKAKPSLASLQLMASRLNQPVSVLLATEATTADQDLVTVLLDNAAHLLQAAKKPKAEATLRQALRLAEERNLAEGQFSSLELLGKLMREQGRYDEALGSFERYLDLAKLLVNGRRVTLGYLQMAETMYRMMQFLVARRYYDRAVRETDERKSLMDLRQTALISKGNCLMRIGDWAPAAATYEEAASLHPFLGERRHLAYAQMGLGVAYRHLGRPEEAHRVTLASLELLQQLGDQSRVLVLQNLATLEGDQGLWHLALPKLETCRTAYQIFDWPASEASLLEELALFDAAAGRYELVEAHCQEALALLDRQDDPILRGRLFKLLGESRLKRGDEARGRELLQASASILRYFGDRELSEAVR
ncbi:MAG TPA: helix-turn-helix transcriptional regulator [Symbiobacteriaceae bacterium]|nr:helix-turn-helix transcriptional regulator [Symbiobacteriaceae bacterium]